MGNDIQPMGIPEKILEDPKAFDLYKWGIWFIGGILSAIVVGTIALTFFGQQVSRLTRKHWSSSCWCFDSTGW